MTAGLLPDRVLRAGRDGFSVRVHPRTVGVCAGLAGVALLAFATGLSVGDFPIPLGQVFGVLVGLGDPDGDFIVRVLRLPRALTGALVGAAFGLSGAIFQRLARNPLASPDIIGVEAGAGAAAVLVIVATGAGGTPVALGALAGALLATLAVYLLAHRRGVTGARLVLVGIGVTAVLSSVTSWLLTRAAILDAQRATVWLTGSLNGRGWEHVWPLAVTLTVVVPVTLALGRRLSVLQFGDEVARGLGVPVEPTRLALLLAGVALAGVATASAGPIAFVALVAPQIARRLTGGGAVALAPAALTGSCVVLLADLAARSLFGTVELPVGVVTAVAGAPFLLWLLARANRIGSAG